MHNCSVGHPVCDHDVVRGVCRRTPHSDDHHRITWSGDAQLFVRGKRIGDFVELRVPCDNPGAKRLTLYATKSWDYGILRFSVNGQTAGKDYDAWSEKPVASGPIEFGVSEPKDGAFRLRVEVVGANPQSKNSKSFFGLDAVALTQP